MRDFKPREIVAELDKYIVGQEEAKRSVAIALRNRIRRERLPKEIADEIAPKNILMIGPTGVGKTEIARRLAKLVQAPFVKVEATKYTEVGYVGRDVESMIRELVENAVQMVRKEKTEELKEKAESLALERLLDTLHPAPRPSPIRALLGGGKEGREATEEEGESQVQRARDRLREHLISGDLDSRTVEIEVEESRYPVVEIFAASGMEEMGMQFQDLFSQMMPKKRKKRKVTIAEAREIFFQEELDRLLDMDAIAKEALSRAEERGIVFIDELDKVAGKGGGQGPDVSREGVQRDLLPMIEGSTAMTKYGAVKTDHILFIGAGAFHAMKPSDLIPELQGRFPIRVELKRLTENDFVCILKEPENALLKQYTMLMSTENVELRFTEGGIRAIARIAQQVNDETEDIGARRLHTILEKVLASVSFEAPDTESPVQITEDYVQKMLREIVKDQDLSRYIL